MLARNIVRKAASISSSSVPRSIYQTSVRRFASSGHGKTDGHEAAGGHGDDHGHDDHAHHPHPMWSSLPFDRKTTVGGIFVVLFGGVGLIIGACCHQNIKHGFWK